VPLTDAKSAGPGTSSPCWRNLSGADKVALDRFISEGGHDVGSTATSTGSPGPTVAYDLKHGAWSSPDHSCTKHCQPSVMLGPRAWSPRRQSSPAST